MGLLGDKVFAFLRSSRCSGEQSSERQNKNKRVCFVLCTRFCTFADETAYEDETLRYETHL